MPAVQMEQSVSAPADAAGGGSDEGLKRRDSDSTLPDSEHTDRPQSSSLQSSGLQSDEEESVTETGTTVYPSNCVYPSYLPEISLY